MLLVLGLLACAAALPFPHPGALGWSLGGEAHVFVVGDKFARTFYRELTGSRHLVDSLTRRPLVSVDAKRARSPMVFSANGVAAARVTLARFHAPQRCGYDGMVTELVLAFAPDGSAARSAPPSQGTVMALLETAAVGDGPSAPRTPITRQGAFDLVNRVARRAVGDAALVRPLVLDPDRATDAGEVYIAGAEYGVGFRARVIGSSGDTLLVTGVAMTDARMQRLRWVIKPQRTRLQRGVIPAPQVRYSLRGSLAGLSGGTLLLIDEFADVRARDSRATAVDAGTRRVLAAQPLALRCP